MTKLYFLTSKNESTAKLIINQRNDDHHLLIFVE